ncbi:hypothetical protein G6F66_013803 [Rhizopus arrhizus]|nr:hypothetical protein G6F66_013803 [Rhizopus arrhizus]
MARALSTSEKNYSTTIRELLAIVFALKKFHPFISGNPFILYTDHKALTYVHTQHAANSMMIQWLDTILDYDFKIIHRPGIQNPQHQKNGKNYCSRPILKGTEAHKQWLPL